MKRFLAFLAAVAMLAWVMPALALDDIVLPAGGGFYEGKTVQPQSDSATGTTANTLYTPRYIGDWLLGKIDGSNAVWLARGLTTNDWSLVDGNGGDFGADDIAANAITEEKLKAVDTAADEDVLTYESTTGDFEWHSVAQIQAKFTEGSYADSTILSADIKDGEITAADMAADSVGASELIEGEVYTVAGITTTGALDIAEGMIKDSMIVSADIKNDEIVDADIKSSAAIAATKISGTAVTYVTASQLSGDTTTDPTTNTPAFRGQVLIGGAGEGTNGVWIAKGTTTNDWVQLVQPVP